MFPSIIERGRTMKQSSDRPTMPSQRHRIGRTCRLGHAHCLRFQELCTRTRPHPGGPDGAVCPPAECRVFAPYLAGAGAGALIVVKYWIAAAMVTGAVTRS